MVLSKNKASCKSVSYIVHWVMSFFDQYPKYYEGKEFDAILIDDCKQRLKRAGVFHKVISRVKKICDSGNFGQINSRYKYYVRKNLGWLKWDDGTRVYFSKFDNDQIVIFLTSGSKNNQTMT
jgi:hypothetical protein